MPINNLEKQNVLPLSKQNNLKSIVNYCESTFHNVDTEEIEQYLIHIKTVLNKDTTFSLTLESFFSHLKDGYILLKLLQHLDANIIDERVINKPLSNKPLSIYHATENLNLLLNTAKALGIHIVNIGASDFLEERKHLVLGLLWQIIKKSLLLNVNLQTHPEIYRLLFDGENLSDFLKLPPEDILIRWMNHHLQNSGSGIQISNLSTDLSNSLAYAYLLKQLDCPVNLPSVCQEKNLHYRAEMILNASEHISCRKYLNPNAIVCGNPRLNLAFVANLFNTNPNLKPLKSSDKITIVNEYSDLDDTTESKIFMLWLNSIGMENQIRDVFTDLKDGNILLQAIQIIIKDLNNSHLQKITKSDKNRILTKFECIENNNNAIEIGKSLGFSLVGIQGSDIYDGNKKLILAFLWQLMRFHLLKTIGSKTENDILSWLKSRCPEIENLNSFSDLRFKDSLIFEALINSIQPNTIASGMLNEDFISNAKLIISTVRKMGIPIFITPEDVVACKPRMIMSLLVGLMSLDSLEK